MVKEVEGYNLRSRKIAKTQFPSKKKTETQTKIRTPLKSCPSKKTKRGGKEEEEEEEGSSGISKSVAFRNNAPWHSASFFEHMKPTGVEPVVTEEALIANRKKWAVWGKKALERYNLMEKALERYNLMEHTDFTYVEEVNVDVHILLPLTKLLAHMNFKAQSANDGSIRLFYAEVYVVWDKDEDSQVKGCCLLDKMDSGNPNSKLCCLCYNTVIHPGPRYGYRSAGGDGFVNSHFSS